MARPWSRAEVEATVTDYFEMLARELRGERFSKKDHNRRLAVRLDERSPGAIERKHQNISAVLIELGCPYINGYKPLSNYQALLRDVVEERLHGARSLTTAIARAVAAPVAAPKRGSGLILDTAPDVEDVGFVVAESSPTRRRAPRLGINYLEREGRNASLGRAGEDLVVDFERARLSRAGRDGLAEKVEHVSVETGDGTGFDIRSFEADGRERLIEVKTTAYGKQTPFFVSRNEVATSRELADRYHLYRVFLMRTEPHLYTVRGSLVDAFSLRAELFSARVA